MDNAPRRLCPCGKVYRNSFNRLQRVVDIDWRDHARIGIPVTLLSLLTVLIL